VEHPHAALAEQDDRQCAACLITPPQHDGLDAVLAYGDAARMIAVRLKHGRRIGLATLIARFMQRYLPDDAAKGENWVIVPVPLHRWRIWQRGFNQSALIAHKLSGLGNFDYQPFILERIRNTPMLQGLSRTQRQKTIRGAIRLRPDKANYVAGKNILLVDDVYTTGATTHACVIALKKAKANQVRILCWSRVLPDALEAGAHIAPIDNLADAPDMQKYG
jgi:ComF family protein